MTGWKSVLFLRRELKTKIKIFLKFINKEIKELSLKLAGYCGIVEKAAPDKPGHVWVRWLGDHSQRQEEVMDLEEI